MRPLLLPKNLTLLSLTRSQFIQVFHFSASPNHHHHQPSYPYSRRHDEESRNVRVSVWWDFENCSLPNGVNVGQIAPAITEAVRANGIKGPLQITAFGDVLQLSKANQEALAYTGIQLTHIPNGGKNSADRSLLIDLMYWVSQNPPPVHLFLISGDKDFAGLLHRLRMSNYNILLATNGRKPPDVLCSAATIMWQWSSLLKGEDLTGKHFNYPPDGPYGSWYGNYKLPLENPFSSVEQSTSSQTVEIYEPTSNSKSGVIPKSVLRRVRHILSSHPKGISISDLHAELNKCGVHLDKSLYGHKKFSLFLLSIPNVQLQSLGEGNFCVQLIPSGSPEASKNTVLPSSTSAVKDEGRGFATTPKLKGEVNNMAKSAEVPHSIASLHERSMDDDPKSMQKAPSLNKSNGEYMGGKCKSSLPSLIERHASQLPNGLQESYLGSEKVGNVADTPLSETKLPPKDNDISKTDSLKSSSKQLPDNGLVRSEDVNQKVSEKYTTPENRTDGNYYTTVENNNIVNDESEKFNDEDIKHEKPTREEEGEVSCRPNFLPVDDSVTDKRPGGSAETYSKGPTFFSWIRSWWPFSKRSSKSVDMTGSEIKIVSHSEEPKIYESDKTVNHSEESKLSELNKIGNHCEETKLSELDNTVNRSEEPKLSELHKIGNHCEETKLSELDNTVNRSEEPMVSDLVQTAKLLDVDQNVSHSGKSELFSGESFWSDMESFVFSPKGSLLLSHSRSRADMAHKLQKNGPMFLRSFTEENILRLVDLLIGEKKWLEERHSQSFPFRLTQPVQTGSLVGQSHGANGLRSLFLNKTPQPSLQKPPQHDVEKQNQNTPYTGVSSLATETKSERSRNDVLVDCQKLVKEVLRDHPDGYNIGTFRKLFLQTYGYHLDIQKLGYQKLASLLQIMPGVKLESTFIFPSFPDILASDEEAPIPKTEVTKANHALSNSDSELSDSAPTDDSIESPWSELGPISVKNSMHSDLESKLSQNDNYLYKPKHPDYEPIVSGDGDSESESDDSCSIQPAEQAKQKCKEQDSSFWQTMDLWDDSREGKKSDGAEALGKIMADIIYPDSSRGTLSEIPFGNIREKHRSQKSYSFVADPVVPNNKEKLVDGIIDGFKKVESKMQN